MKTILALYLTSTLHYSQDDATILYHIFGMLCYFFPLIGAIIADSFWGKFKTILYLSLVYACGNVVLSFSSIAIPTIPYRELSLLGLLMIAIGTGGIKPCVSAFGGDQFVLPNQALQLQRFFSIFYFSINAGSLISTFFTPILRNEQCFDQETCFPLAFGTPSILMIISIVMFLCGKRLYVIRRPKENVITIFFNCIARALKNKFFGGGQSNDEKDYWLDYAGDKYSKQQINDIRAVLNVLYLFIPVPLFWALYDQQGSRWTFQATNMDGRFFGFDIKPDQMQVMNPLLILLFIPIFELYIYPILSWVGIKRPLQKLSLGGLLAALSFATSAYLEFFVQESYATLPLASEGQIRIFNALNCGVKLTPAIENVNHISAFSAAEFLHVPVSESNKVITASLSVDAPCNFIDLQNAEFQVNKEKTASYFIYEKSDKEISLYKPNSFDSLVKNEDGIAKISVFYNILPANSFKISLISDSSSVNFRVEGNTRSDFQLIRSGTYDVLIDDKTVVKNIEIYPGEVDTLLLRKNQNETIASIVNLVPPNKIHMLWQLPQIIILTAGEIMFSITGLEFSFTQAPESMKSVLSSAWLLTVAFGNLIVVIISEINIFKNQAYEFLLFAGLMVLDILLFMLLSLKYRYVDSESNHPISEKNDENNEMSSQATSLSDLDN